MRGRDESGLSVRKRSKEPACWQVPTHILFTLFRTRQDGMNMNLIRSSGVWYFVLLINNLKKGSRVEAEFLWPPSLQRFSSFLKPTLSLTEVRLSSLARVTFYVSEWILTFDYFYISFSFSSHSPIVPICIDSQQTDTWTCCGTSSARRPLLLSVLWDRTVS